VSGGRGRTALVLIDLQHDYLGRPGLVPDVPSLCARAAALLAGVRRLGLPVVHARTLVRPDGSDSMPHWKRQGLLQCVEGTSGAEPPAALASVDGELVARKRYFSAFGDPRLEPWLRGRGIDRLVLAGVYTHACIRSTALDAYERGFEVCIVDDAVGTTEPLHAEITRAYLAERAASFRTVADVLAALAGDGGSASRPSGDALPVAVIAGARRAAEARRHYVHRDPCRVARVLSQVPLGAEAEIADAVRTADASGREWARVVATERAAFLERWATDLDAHRGRYVDLLVREIGKPRRAAEEEAGRAVAHARVAAELVRTTVPTQVAPGISAAPRSLGVVGLVTPWNNPLAIPVGKIAPAVGFGNGVVLKPAPQGSETALALLESLDRAGLPRGVVNLVLGTNDAVRALCRHPLVAGVSVTGSLETGRTVAALAAQVMKPLQAELGGNNAAIVLADAELERVVPELVRAAFVFAGQRCTAIRRFVVERAIAARFEAMAVDAIRGLAVGDPDDRSTEVGPLVSMEHRDRVLATIEHARADGARLAIGGTIPSGLTDGAWLTPALLVDAARESRIVQEETFGPVAVLQVANDLEDALALANGVRQGLLQSVHTRDSEARARALAAAEVGMVQLSSGPLAVHPRAPFSAWKASGLGPPEHGIWDAAFYTRTQAVYEDPTC
jgi:acyl-CoA reductase-like NAD-dependent aldehyde dehydrogenase/nicotinamidase-related amidase